MNDLENFKKIVYKYYPKNICASKDKLFYEKTEEFILITKIINDISIHFDIKLFKINLEEKIKQKVFDFTLFSWYDRSYNIQFRIGNKNSKSFIFCINISVLIPYYICYILEVEKDEELNRLKFPPRRNFIIENSIFKNKIEMVKSFIEENTTLMEFPESILYNKINNINFQDIEMGNFTFFNAFFLNEYHTRLV